nr:hypothetical protein [Tanacetum cinerariifolium]
DDDDDVEERSDDQDDDDQDDDDQDEGNDDDQDTDNEGDEFVLPKLSIHEEEETKDEESFDLIAKTPENSDDEGNDDASLGLNVGSEKGHDAEDDEDELYRDVNINLGRDVQMTDVNTTQEFEDTYVTLTVKVAVQIQSDRLRDKAQVENEEFLKNLDENIQKIIKEKVKEQVKVQVSKILPKIEKTVNEQLEAKVLIRSSNSSKTSYAVAADLSEMELEKILIKKIESNKIIAVTELLIVEWHNYKHLDWITVRRDDDKLYKFKEGDFKRLCIQDIEDMLLLLVQGKLTNLTVKERFAFNVSLRMFTRSIVIQRHVEDLQLAVESYQKKLNLTKPDMYRSDLKRKEAYIAYSNPRGFIYQNKHKENRLMRIDDLHKFSNGTLNDVRTTLDDRLKGIRMKYLPQAIWMKSDKEKQ